jgi:hypothetical protein
MVVLRGGVVRSWGVLAGLGGCGSKAKISRKGICAVGTWRDGEERVGWCEMGGYEGVILCSEKNYIRNFACSVQIGNSVRRS